LTKSIFYVYYTQGLSEILLTKQVHNSFTFQKGDHNMIKTLKLLMAILLVSFGATAFAQCIPPDAPGPPRHWDGARGCYVPMGTPTVQYGNQQVVYGQQQQGYGQQQVMQMAPSIGSGIGNAFTKCETLGGIAGGTIGSLALNNTTQATILGAIVGGVAGNILCNSQGQYVVQGQQQVVQRQGVTQSQQVVQQQGSPLCAPPANPAGTRPGVLNLPGSPMHGQTVCAKPGDTNISQWL
jgi:hypothetical protein